MYKQKISKSKYNNERIRKKVGKIFGEIKIDSSNDYRQKNDFRKWRKNSGCAKCNAFNKFTTKLNYTIPN